MAPAADRWGHAYVLKDELAEDMYAPRDNVGSERGQVRKRIVLVDVCAGQYSIRRRRAPLGYRFRGAAGHGLYDVVPRQRSQRCIAKFGGRAGGRGSSGHRILRGCGPIGKAVRVQVHVDDGQAAFADCCLNPCGRRRARGRQQQGNKCH